MTNRQEVKLRMYHVVLGVLDNNKSLVERVEMLAKEAANLRLTVKNIEEEHPKQAVDTKGVTQSIHNQREELGETANILAGALYSYGAHLGNTDLCERMNIYPSTLQRATLADFKRICSEVLSEAEKAGEALLKYGIEANTIVEFKGDLEKYGTEASQPRQSQVEKSTATLTLEELFTRADDILFNHIDGLVLPFKRTNVEFYLDYQNARVIVDRGSRAKKDGNEKDTQDKAA